MLHIPRIMHRIWVGDKPMPVEHAEWIDRWRIIHPNWLHRLWGDAELLPLVDSLGLHTVWEEAPHESYRSDIGRFAVLWTQGGIYMDTDYEPLRSIDELLHGCFAFVSWEQNNPHLGCHVCGGMIGVVPFHPLIRQLLDAVPSAHAVLPRRNNLGPPLVDRVVKSRLDVRIFEKHILIGPWSYAQRREIPVDSRGERLAESAYAVHHYAASWV